MDDADLLEVLLNSLASEASVYARWCWSSGGDLAHHVHDLARTAEADWSHEAVEGATGPTTAEEIEAALRPIARESAIELMVNLAADSLVFPGHARRDRAHAKRAAAKTPHAANGSSGPWSLLLLIGDAEPLDCLVVSLQLVPEHGRSQWYSDFQLGPSDETQSLGHLDEAGNRIPECVPVHAVERRETELPLEDPMEITLAAHRTDVDHHLAVRIVRRLFGSSPEGREPPAQVCPIIRPRTAIFAREILEQVGGRVDRAPPRVERFVVRRGPGKPPTPLVAGAIGPEVLLSLGERPLIGATWPERPAELHRVIFPETDRADGVGTRPPIFNIEDEMTTAGAGATCIHWASLVCVLNSSDLVSLGTVTSVRKRSNRKGEPSP